MCTEGAIKRRLLFRCFVWVCLFVFRARYQISLFALDDISVKGTSLAATEIKAMRGIILPLKEFTDYGGRDKCV